MMKMYRVLVPASFDFYIKARNPQEAAVKGFALATRETTPTLWLHPESAEELEIEELANMVR